MLSGQGNGKLSESQGLAWLTPLSSGFWLQEPVAIPERSSRPLAVGSRVVGCTAGLCIQVIVMVNWFQLLGPTLVAVCCTALFLAQPLLSLPGLRGVCHAGEGGRWHVECLPSFLHMVVPRWLGGVVLVGWLPCQAHPAPRLAAVLGGLGLALACQPGHRGLPHSTLLSGTGAAPHHSKCARQPLS